MAEVLFVLELGSSTYVDARGLVTATPPPGAVVLPKPPGMHLDAGAVSAAMRELADPDVGFDAFSDRWVEVGQDKEAAEFVFKAIEAMAITGGVMLSVTQPWWLVAAVVVGGALSVFVGGEEADGEVLAEARRIRLRQEAEAIITEKRDLLGMWSGIKGPFEAIHTKWNEVQTHNLTGATRLAAFEDMTSRVLDASESKAIIRDNEWLSAYDLENNVSRFALSPILRRVQADGTLYPVTASVGGPTRFDYRLGLPLVLGLANAYPAMLAMAAPLHRSTGTYRTDLRGLAQSLDRFAVKMQEECLSRTEYTAQSLMLHGMNPNMLYLGSPFVESPQWQWNPWPPASDTYPVGAFDLVRYTDAFVAASSGKAFASGGDEGVVGTFDYTWEPPATLTTQMDQAAAAANEQATQDYARLVVVSGAIHVLIASAMLRFLAAPPLTSETVFGAATGSRTLASEEPTQATSPVIFPNVQISAPATLRTYKAMSTMHCTTQEPAFQPPLQYRVVLRTIDSLFGKDAWRDSGYRGWVWTPEMVPLTGDPQNLKLRTEVVVSRVLDEKVLHEGQSPTEPLTLPRDSAKGSVTFTAHTYDWYVPEASPPWAQGRAAGKGTHLQWAGQSTDGTTPGARSIHLTQRLERVASVQPFRTIPYHERTREALTSYTSDTAEGSPAGQLLGLGPSMELAERRHVRNEPVTVDWQLHWDDGQLVVRLWGRPENRSCQIFVVVEERVESGEGSRKFEWLHTPFAAELVNQLTLVPKSFFDDERAALEHGERLWDDTLRRFAESTEVGPEDPIVSAVFEARQVLTESASTATLGAALDMRFDAVRHHRPDLWSAAVNTST